jgi:hypothetical protein
MCVMHAHVFELGIDVRTLVTLVPVLIVTGMRPCLILQWH